MKKKGNGFAVVCFALSAVLLLVTASFAAYTSLSSVKRVVTVKGTEQLFTSNILLSYTNENELQTRIVSFSQTNDKKIVEIDIANYMQGDATKFDNFGIVYDLKLELIDTFGNRVNDQGIFSLYTINGAQMTANPVVISDKLSGQTATKKLYQVEIPSEYMTTMKLKVTAVPKDSKYLSIGRIIASSTEQHTAHWSGSFFENEQSVINKNEDLGIINYQISGHMEEDCILSWDAGKVEIDAWFLKDMGIKEDMITRTGGRKSVVLHLGAENTPDQYTIKFYRTYSVNDMDENWNDISNINTGYVTFRNIVTE